jgi:hypothetical protein
MKNYLLIALILFSCNSAENKAGIGGDTTETKAGEKSNDSSPAACNKLIFFKTGAEIEAKSYNAEGVEISSQLTKILSVQNEGGMTVANVEGSDIQTGNGKTTNVKYSYKCDGNKIYFDIASMFRTEKKEGDASFESSMVEYPINISAGETLPDATGTMNSERNGKKMTMKYHYRNRKVDGKEDITTTAGTWSCYKISNTVEVEMDIPGMDETSKKMMEAMKDKMKTTTTTWFAPDFGIVKMEMYMNGKLQSRNEVTGVKR